MATDAPENLGPMTGYQAGQHIAKHFDSLLGDVEEAEAKPEVTEEETKAPQETEEATNEADSEQEDVNAEATESESEDDDSEEGVELTLENLARHYGVETDDLYGLELPTKVNGEEGTASLRDLVKSYQLESAINQKSMKLSDELKQTEREREQISRERELYEQQLAPFVQHLNQLVAQDDQVNWEKLAEEDPQAYLREKANSDARKHAKEQAEQQYQYLRSQHLQEHLQKEFVKLPELIPEWSDPEVKKTEAAELTHYMKNNGYTDEDIQSINYGKSEWIATIRKAMLYDKTKGNVDSKKKVAKAPKLKVKAGAARDRKEDAREARNAKLKRLKQTGKVDDGARVIYDLID